MTAVHIVDYINFLRSFYLNFFDGYWQIIFYGSSHSHITALGISVTSITSGCWNTKSLPKTAHVMYMVVLTRDINLLSHVRRLFWDESQARTTPKVVVSPESSRGTLY